MTSKDKQEDPAAYQAAVEAICETYEQAPALQEQGVHVVSCDEKTGMQATERHAPTKPTRPGDPSAIDLTGIIGLTGRSSTHSIPVGFLTPQMLWSWGS